MSGFVMANLKVGVGYREQAGRPFRGVFTQEQKDCLLHFRENIRVRKTNDDAPEVPQ